MAIDFSTLPTVSLEELLESREQRGIRQRELLAAHGSTLISFTMNIPGPCKRFVLADQGFAEGGRLIRQRLLYHHIPLMHQEEVESRAGNSAFYVVDAEPEQVKTLMVDIEESCPFGRLLDIDVLSPSGEILSRKDTGGAKRRCLICGESAHACGRSQHHSMEELQRVTASILKGYLHTQCADRIQNAACRALLCEVSTTPKPGLVDKMNNGAHRDMDLLTFVHSTAALLPYFRECTLAGLDAEGSPAELFQRARYLGQMAEDTMLAATGGVNTHKGIVFSLGVLCAAAGRLCQEGPLDGKLNELLHYCSAMTADIFRDFADVTAETAKTAGEQLYAAHQITGIRGEVLAGFPSVQEHGLPTLRRYLSQGCSLNDAGVATLLHLMAYVCDTNVIRRSDLAQARWVQEQTKTLLSNSADMSALLEGACILDDALCRRNISPGGCADLLAVTYMLFFLLEEHDIPTANSQP